MTMNRERAKIRESLLITPRDLQIFQKLNSAGWLTSIQILQYFFPDKSTNAVCKRLRKLAHAGYIASSSVSSTEPNLFRLASKVRFALLEPTVCLEVVVVGPL